jgi:putative glutamine amidotransferase
MSRSIDQRLKIGVSACFFHADPARPIFTGKTLHYVEESIAHWVMSQGDLAVMVPSPTGATRRSDVDFSHYAQWLDALVLMGGADVWPGSYGEAPLQERWSGDRVRDDYERALVQAFVAAGKPVLGVCRGLQLINVAFGGTLYQDIPTQLPQALVHRDAQAYDNHLHDLSIDPQSRLCALLGGQTEAVVNSIHHQGIKDLAPDFVVEARCPHDGMIEAIRWSGPAYVAAVQWHPEFHRADQGTLDDTPILRDFLRQAHQNRQAN